MMLSVWNSTAASTSWASELLELAEDEEVKFPSTIFLTAGKSCVVEAPSEDNNMDSEEIWKMAFANFASLDLSIEGLCPCFSNSTKSSNKNS